jgi:hypothetical protein
MAEQRVAQRVVRQPEVARRSVKVMPFWPTDQWACGT